jgi:hypothetical protein
MAGVLPIVAVPVVSLLWWALGFLAWTRARHPLTLDSWPPTLPVLYTDLEVAVFGSIGAGLVVVALLRRTELAFLSILLGLGVAGVVTLARGADIYGAVVNNTERYLMLGICAFASFAGLAIGTVAITSLRAFGFLGLLAVVPVASLVGALVPGAVANPDLRWPVRIALVGLLVMTAWRAWSGVLLWPVFFALFWLLGLVMAALTFGARTLRHPGGSQASIWSVADAMRDFIRSAWIDMLGASWRTFWPAAAVAAVAVAALYTWRRLQVVES